MMNKDTTYGYKNEDASTEFYDLTTGQRVKKSKISEKDFKDFVRSNNRFKKRTRKTKKYTVNLKTIQEEKHRNKYNKGKVTDQRVTMSHKDDKLKKAVQSFECAKKYESTDFTRAVELYERSATLYREAGHKRNEGVVYCHLGCTYNNLGQYARAAEFHEKDLVITRDVGDRTAEGVAYGNLGSTYYSLGQFTKAMDFFEKSLVTAQQLGDRSMEGRAYGGLGIVYYNLGHFEKAVDFQEKDLAIARELGDIEGERDASVLCNAYKKKLIQKKEDEVIAKVINESIMTAQVDESRREDEIIAKVINESIMTAQVDESRRENNFHTLGRYESDILYYENEAKEKIVNYIVSLLDVDENVLMSRDLNYLIELSRNIEDEEMEREKCEEQEHEKIIMSNNIYYKNMTINELIKKHFPTYTPPLPKFLPNEKRNNM
jgi:tetratricopeptide (TPR) repeat protein